MRRLLTFILLPVVLAGCAVVPGLDLPDPGIGATRFANAPANADTAWPDAAWWRRFDSAELNRLVAEASAGNRDLRAAAFRIVQAEAASRSAAAPLFPQLSASGSASRGRGAAGSLGGGVRDSLAGSLVASYEVDLWGSLRNAAAAGQSRLLSSRYDRDATALSITAETASAYFDLLAQRERLALARRTLEAARRILSVIETQVRAGGASDLELQQQRSAVASQQASVEALAGLERQALDALAVLVGRRPDQLAIGADSLEGLRLPPITAGIPSELLLRRPDIAKAEADFQAGVQSARSARGARFPSLVLTADGGQRSVQLTDFLSLDRAIWTLAGSLAAPIFQGGRLEAAEDQAVGRAEELAETYAGTVLAAFRDVEDALAAADAARRSHALRQAAFSAAEQAYRIAETRWRAGAADFLSVLQAQQSTFSAADALAQANLARFNAQISLYRALGGGWDGNAARTS